MVVNGFCVGLSCIRYMYILLSAAADVDAVIFPLSTSAVSNVVAPDL